MEITKRKDAKNPIMVTMTDGTEIIVPRQGKFKTKWLRRHGCPFVSLYEAMQFTGIHGTTVKGLWQWALKHAGNHMGASLRIRGVEKVAKHFIVENKRGTVKYFSPKQITTKRLTGYLKAGCLVIITRRKPSIHYYVAFMDAGVIYTLNYQGGGNCKKKSAKFLVSTRCRNKDYGGMIVVTRPKGTPNQAAGETPKKPKKKKPKKKSNKQIAKEVINGRWGNGEARKKKLKAAGYNYNKIQKLVNKMVRK